MYSILEKHKKADLAQFIDRWHAVDASIDRTIAYNLALASLRYYKGDASARGELREFQELEKYWYDSLDRGQPDFSVYNSRYFLSDIWACWVIYSRKYLLSTRQHIIDKMTNVWSIADLGNGFGYTTMGLKELFPQAAVFGTNFPNSIQWKFCEALGVKMYANVRDIGRQIDLIFASEYFEHIEDPINHLRYVLMTCKPKYLLLANAFGAKSVGHFDNYKISDGILSGKDTGRAFNEALRFNGYRKVPTKCWNQRPAFWARG